MSTTVNTNYGMYLADHKVYWISFNSMDHFMTLLFGYLLQTGLILLWHNVRLLKKKHFDASKCEESIWLQCYVMSFQKNCQYKYNWYKYYPIPWLLYMSQHISPTNVLSKLEIDYDINTDIKDHFLYWPLSMEILDKNNNIRKVPPSYHILDPYFQVQNLQTI